MAISTANKGLDLKRRVLYGQPIPDNVVQVATFDNWHTHGFEVVWLSAGDKVVHRMELPQEPTPDQVTAIIVAMRLTC